MIIVCTDSDGVLKDGKKPISKEIISAIEAARACRNIMIVRITGAPITHLLGDLKVNRAFGESGGVELLSDGGIAISEYAQRAVKMVNALKRALQLKAEDGIVDSPYGRFGLEGVRYTTMTFFFGHHPLYPGQKTSANYKVVSKWVQESIQGLKLPLYMTKGMGKTYTYIDIGHPQVMKKERVVSMILNETAHERAYYLGDSGNDAGAMRLKGIIPVTFSNGTEQVKQIVLEKNGVMIEKPGPYGGVEEFCERLVEDKL